MPPVRRRLAVTLAAILGAAIVLLATAILVPAWQARYHAARLLTCLHDLHPAITTESQARAQLMPFSGYEDSYAGHDRDRFHEVSYTLYNVNEWVLKVAHVLPISWAEHLALPWTMFRVAVRYQDGVLSELFIEEMQEDFSGGPHPNAASTTILSTRLGQQLRYLPSIPSDFNGYSVRSRSTGEVDANGNWTGFSCCHERFITLDERATPAQLADSLNFQLHCLTSWRRCRDDRQILP